LIFGKTREDRNRAIFEWRCVFAWWPMRLDDGRTAWLEWIEYRWFDDYSANWAGDSSRWQYREKETA
jgi:hypothetical protein